MPKRDDDIARAQRCADEIAAVLRTYKCKLVVHRGSAYGDREGVTTTDVENIPVAKLAITLYDWSM